MTGLRFQLCGQFAVELDGRRVDAGLAGRQARRLVAYLATNPNRPLTRDELAGAVWGDSLPAEPDSGLSPLLSRVRRVLGADRVRGRTELVLVDDGDVFVDALYAADAVHRAETLLAARAWAEAAQPGHTAYQIADRPFLPGQDGDWIDAWRHRLDDLRVRGLECYTEGELHAATGSLTAAEAGARLLVEIAPFRESGWGLLMDVLGRRGNAAEALLLYERLRQLLRSELGVTPCPALQRRHRRLLEAASEAS